MSQFNTSLQQIRKAAAGAQARRGVVMAVYTSTIHVRRYGSASVLRNVKLAGATTASISVGMEVEIDTSHGQVVAWPTASI